MCAKFQVAFLKKRLSFTVLNAQKATSYGIYKDLGIFSDFNLASDLGRSRSVLGSFLRSWRKYDPKTCTHHPKLQILSLTFSDLFTFDDLHLT